MSMSFKLLHIQGELCSSESDFTVLSFTSHGTCEDNYSENLINLH